MGEIITELMCPKIQLHEMWENANDCKLLKTLLGGPWPGIVSKEKRISSLLVEAFTVTDGAFMFSCNAVK